ncbi:MAG TPA: type VI secretion system ATPase TssH, partial [Pirellulales bacterium]
MDTAALKALINRLDSVCKKALEQGAQLCVSRTNYHVEIEHILLKLLDDPSGDFSIILRHYGANSSRVAADLTKALDRFKTGNAAAPGFSTFMGELLQEAWLVASLRFGAPKIRSGHILAAVLSSDTLSERVLNAVKDFSNVKVAELKDKFDEICGKSSEASEEASAIASSAPAGPGGAPAAGGAKGTETLDQVTVDLTAQARAGKIDPILGRDAEIRQVIDILTRRRQNNPILTGEAGVGKTAVVEGFALRIATGDVPPALKNVTLRTLDLGLLQAGAGMKGEFENRLRKVIDEVKSSPKPIILFIDEAHTMIGAGGQAGQNDAANLLKPALARGELRTIAATTWDEYKKYFEKDPALTRRFQTVKVEEPTETIGIQMMRGLVKVLEKHHKVRILDEAVAESVRLSSRYIAGRQLPDKSVSLLDTACARVSMSQSAIPGPIEDRRRSAEQLGVEIGILEREEHTGGEHSERIAKARKEKETLEAEMKAFETQWVKERELVAKIQEIRGQLDGAREAAEQAAAGGNGAAPAAVPQAAGATTSAPSLGGGSAAAAAATGTATTEAPAPLTKEQQTELRKNLVALEAELKALQGDHPLINAVVDGQAVAAIVGNWTGIPVGRMVSNEIEKVLNLKEEMEARVIGQSHALDAIAQRIRMSRANLTDPNKPIGVFMLVGLSGTGKTETAITLAELLYGGEQNMTVINMTEFKDKSKVSTLLGAAIGLVGADQGGVLTEAIRRKPYSVVLLDELEKADPDVQELFYQMFDKGTLTDSSGREVDCKNCVIIMTSNAGTDFLTKLWQDPDTFPDDPTKLTEAMFPELLKTFKPAFLGRTQV